MHEIGVREVMQVESLGLNFNIETLEMTWLVMAIVILIAWLATRNLKMVPTECARDRDHGTAWTDGWHDG